MLEACTQAKVQRMKPYLQLPLKEFKFKLKMVAQEETSRGNFPVAGRRFPTHGHMPGQRSNSFGPGFSRTNAINEIQEINPDQSLSGARAQGN